MSHTYFFLRLVFKSISSLKGIERVLSVFSHLTPQLKKTKLHLELRRRANEASDESKDFFGEKISLPGRA